MKKEILTYEVFKDDEFHYLSIPVNSLINPKFLLKQNDLIIFLHNYSQSFIIKEIPNEIIQSIFDNKCILLENLNLENNNKHLIKLYP